LFLISVSAMMFKLWILGFIKINCPISQWTYTNDFFIISQWTYTNDFFIISQWTYTNDFFIISTNNSYTSSFCYKMFFTDNRTLKWKKYIPTRYFVKQTAVFPNIWKCCTDGEYSHSIYQWYVKGVLNSIGNLQVMVSQLFF
jgi:hypothetical protein